MALLKDMPFGNTGLVAKYHNIMDIHYEPKLSIHIRVRSYMDEASRRGIRDSLFNKIYAIPLIVEEVDVEAGLTGNIMTRAYLLLKTHEGWLGSTDV